MRKRQRKKDQRRKAYLVVQTTAAPPTWAGRAIRALQAEAGLRDQMVVSTFPTMPSAPQDHRPPRPLRSTPLRQLPDPTPHPIVPAANLGWERNWQEEQPGSEFEGRWLMVPVFGSSHSPHMIVFSEKGMRRNSLGWTTRRRFCWSNDKPASMTAGEHQRWLRDHEREIDQWYELTTLDIPERPSWEGYWEEYDTGTGPDYRELIRRRKAELREKNRVPGVHVINGSAWVEFREIPEPPRRLGSRWLGDDLPSGPPITHGPIRQHMDGFSSITSRPMTATEIATAAQAMRLAESPLANGRWRRR